MSKFSCRYCQHSHSLNDLAGTLTNQREIQTIQTNIELVENKRANLVFRDLPTEQKQVREQK